ncbi:UNVERIFIED_CONTAM: protein, chloroplastic [Sesamum radiatum]|uniref:Protein, chloroplastic n=1 Tax=Sesamum radiatum TaxID=300843 RepID=A0AAW2KZP1_SESRA
METKVSGSLLRPRFDIKWTAPRAEGSLSDARGDVIISPDHVCVNSSSAAFELYMKVLTSYPDENQLNWRECGKLDATGRPDESLAIELVGPLRSTSEENLAGKLLSFSLQKGTHLPLDELELASLRGAISRAELQLNFQKRRAMVCYLFSGQNSVVFWGKLWTWLPDGVGMCYFCVQVQFKIITLLQTYFEWLESFPFPFLVLVILLCLISTSICFLPDILGDALDTVDMLYLVSDSENIKLWSIITVERAILEQSSSKYELQGEYVLPGSRDRSTTGKETGSLFQRVMTGHLGSMISSMGRWRMRLEVPNAEIAEMLPLARLLSRSSDPAVQSRSKMRFSFDSSSVWIFEMKIVDLFIQSLQSVGLCAESLQKLLEDVRGHCAASYEVVLDDFDLPGLAELKGRWRGSLDASGGGNGDTTAEFDFHGEEWEWGTYTTQRILAAGMYSNNDGLRLEKIFIQRDNATIHADGTALGPKTNLHFAVLNFPVSLVPTLVQVIENSATEAVHSLRQLLAPIRGILHMEGDLKGNLAKPECDVQVRLLDGAIGGIELGRAEVVASLTPTSRFLFNAKFEPIVQNGHVHIQGSIPLTLVQNNISEEEGTERIELKPHGFEVGTQREVKHSDEN